MNQTIWTYWHQGFENAPLVVKHCIQKLKDLHPDFTIHLLDAQNVYDFAEKVSIDNKKWEKLRLQHQSDILRTQLLIRYGGIWLDPTVFCLQPLNEWLPKYLENDLFLFHRPGKDRIISNWFIAGKKDNYLLKQLYQHLIDYWDQNEFRNLGRQNSSRIEYWSNRIINGRSLKISQLWLSPLFTKLLRLYPYMIYHYFFYHLITTDARCSDIYGRMSKVSADGPHRLQRLGLLDPITREGQDLIDGRKVPLLKLKWKIPLQEIPTNSHLGYLFNQ